MKTIKLFFIYILILFGLVACSVTTYSVITDYDQEAKFDDYQTFYWSDNFQANNPDVEDPLFYN